MIMTQKTDKKGAAGSSAESDKPITPLKLGTVLKHYQSNDSNAALVAQAVKHVFGEDAAGKELFIVWSGNNTSAWDAATANGQAAITIIAEAKKAGYSDAAVQALEEAAESREKFCIMNAVDDLEKNLPPTKAIGNEFWSYQDGMWSHQDWNTYRKPALSALPRENQCNKTAEEVLRTLEAKNQIDRSKFGTCYRFDGDDAVLINCANGVLRVTSKATELLPHSPDYFFTGKLLAKWDPTAMATLFLETLHDALPDESDQMALRWWGGYLLYPQCRFKVCLICIGPSNTRKTTLVEHGLCSIFPGDPEKLKQFLSMADICCTNGYSVPGLQNAAVNVGGELQASELAESARWKSLVGGETFQVREIRGRPYDMSGYALKLIFLTNHMPKFRFGTDAEYSRTRFIKFGVVPAEIRPELRYRIENERDAIFTQFMVPGLQGILKGDGVPDGGQASQAIREQFFFRNDPYDAFVRERCILEPNASDTKDRIKGAFRAFVMNHDFSLKLVGPVIRVLKEKYGLKDHRPGRRIEARKWCLAGIAVKDGVAIEERDLNCDEDED
jgi:hypothetical protein